MSDEQAKGARKPTTPRWKQALAPLASLKLTVFLLVLGILLVFGGTLAQVDRGIQSIQDDYFRSWVVAADFHFFHLWLPGGWLVGGAMLANLLAAHAVRFRVGWSQVGIHLIHLGIVLLLVGEVLTATLAVETTMRIREGQAASYSFDVREVELAVVDPSPADVDMVTVIPQDRLEAEGRIAHHLLPFDVQVDQFMANSRVAAARGQPTRADRGVGAGAVAIEEPEVSGIEGQTVDAPSAYVSLFRDDEFLGTYLLSLWIEEPQRVEVDGKAYDLSLRFRRDYKDYRIELGDFRFDRYTGTEIAKNYSSRVRIVDPAEGVDREVLIYMNHPLYYRGETFYQSSFSPDERGTVLQVVRNPGWTVPYVAVTLGALGMLIHFGMLLRRFLRRRRDAEARAAGAAGEAAEDETSTLARVGPWLVVGVGVLFLLAPLARSPLPAEPDLPRAAQLPVSFRGRVKPLDTVARNALLVVYHRQTFKDADGGRVPALEWLLELLSNPQAATERPVFRIDHPQVLGLLDIEQERSRTFLSFEELVPHWSAVRTQAARAGETSSREQSPFQRKVVELFRNMQLFQRLSSLDLLHPVPPASDDEDWATLPTVLQRRADPASDPQAAAAKAWAEMLMAYRDDDAAAFADALDRVEEAYPARVAPDVRKAWLEVHFNRVGPFMQAAALYVLVFLLTAVSWIAWPRVMARSAFYVLVLAFCVHTVGLVLRIYLMGRPPVTNLYSSAVFVGWGCVLAGIVLERLFKSGMGSLVASVVAFPTLLLAWGLTGDGDTMAVLQAVLDTNFWLATHVVVITLGYAATFLAGFLGVLYVVRSGVARAAAGLDLAPAERVFGKAPRRDLVRAAYGILCFATLFSFVGTILGGIWADQSWGRFWGWDPKENGALLIVLWNAVVLHGRWGGVVRERGVMNLLIFGNVVTAWSWFGTNLMGVGLHAYGFMEQGVFWLYLFVGSQLGLIGLGALFAWLGDPKKPAGGAPGADPDADVAVLPEAPDGVDADAPAEGGAAPPEGADAGPAEGAAAEGGDEDVAPEGDAAADDDGADRGGAVT